MSSLTGITLLTQQLQQMSDDHFEITWINLEEFRKGLSDGPADFDHRLKRFLELATLVPGRRKQEADYYQLWLNFPRDTFRPFQEEFNLDLRAFFGAFESNTLTQASSGELHTTNFFNIKVFDEDDQKTPLLQIRLNPNGTLAEIVYIKKGQHLSGTHLKEIALMILNYFKPDLVYLNDDARFTFAIPNTSNTLTVPIRSYLPIINKEGETWYGKTGFSPMQCKDLQTSDPKIQVSQDPTLYYRAVKTVRTTTLKSLYCEILTETSKATLISLCQRYLPALNLTGLDRNQRRLASFTVHDLGYQIYLAVSTLQGQSDLALFIQKIIARNADNPHHYYRALEQIYLTCLWKYSYRNPLENTSYLEIESLLD